METIANIFQAQIVQRLGWTLMHFVWQGLTVGVVLAIVLKLLHKSSANLRYVIACIALVLIVLMPTVTIRMIEPSAEVVTAAKSPAVDFSRVDPGTKATVEMPQIESPLHSQAAVAPRVPLKDRLIAAMKPALPFVVVGWLVGVFGLSLWHLGGWCQLQRLRRQMVKQVAPTLKAKLEQLSDMLGIRQAVGLVESALVQVPTVVGHLKPVILLPASALTGLSIEQIEAVLAHELAHIKRCDYLVNMLQTVVEILGFYHPAVWWVSHRIRLERENCCDDLAVSLCNDRVCYAKALATMEEIRGCQPALAVAASGGNLLMRIRRLLGKDSANEGKLSWLPAVIAILLIMALIIPTALALSSKSNVDLANKGTGDLTHLISIAPQDMTVERLADICEGIESAIIDVAVDYEKYRDPPARTEDIAGTGMLITVGPEKHHWSTTRPFSDFSLTSLSANFTNGSDNIFHSTTKQSYNGKIGKRLQIVKRPNQPTSTPDGAVTKSKRFVAVGSR